MKEKDSETGVVVIDKRLAKALSHIDATLKEVKKATDTPYQTNGQFRWNPNYTNNEAIDIHKSKDVMLLVSIYASLNQKSNDYDLATKECNLDKYPIYKWMSYTWDAWKNDLKTRIALVSNDDVIKKLKENRKILEESLTKEQRLSKVLDDMGY